MNSQRKKYGLMVKAASDGRWEYVAGYEICAQDNIDNDHFLTIRLTATTANPAEALWFTSREFTTVAVSADPEWIAVKETEYAHRGKPTDHNHEKQEKATFT